MRGLVTFDGPLVTATTLLRLFGCEVVAATEDDGLALVEVSADGPAASLIAIADSQDVLAFELGESLGKESTASGVFSPVEWRTRTPKAGQ